MEKKTILFHDNDQSQVTKIEYTNLQTYPASSPDSLSLKFFNHSNNFLQEKVLQTTKYQIKMPSKNSISSRTLEFYATPKIWLFIVHDNEYILTVHFLLINFNQNWADLKLV